MKLSLLLNDIRLQWRQGFWLVYLILTAIYLAILFSLPTENRYFATAIIVFMDTSVLGLVFVGALLLFEKQQHTLESIFLSPLNIKDYILSKTLSLTILATSVGIILIFLPNHYEHNYFLVLFTVISSAFMYTLLGLGIASKTQSVNQYFMKMMLGSFIVIFPSIPFLLLHQTPWLLIFPTNAAIDLMLLPHESQALWRVLLNSASMLLWCYLAYRFALRKFQQLRNS